MFIFLEFPAAFLPLTFPGARLLMELPGMLESEKLCLEYLWKSQSPTPTPGFCFKFQCLRDRVHPPTLTPPLNLGLMMSSLPGFYHPSN